MSNQLMAFFQIFSKNLDFELEITEILEKKTLKKSPFLI